MSYLSRHLAAVRGLLTSVGAVITCFVIPWPTHAAEPIRVTIDPGHGGSEIGASYTFSSGIVLREKALNLRVALRLRDLLRQAGYEVTVTRTSDSLVNKDQRDLTGNGKVNLADDLQARVDKANRAGSDLFISVHFNGAADPELHGTYTFWNPDRPFSERSKVLAEQVQAALVRDLHAAGYATKDRGARTDKSILGGDTYYLLSPRSSVVPRPSSMPAVIAEPLFLTNPKDAAALESDRVLEAVARGYFEGIRGYSAKLASSPKLGVSQASMAAVPQQPSGSAPTQPREAANVHKAPQPKGAFWTVLAVTYQDTPKGRRLSTDTAESLSAKGLPSAVLETDRFQSLRPGFLVVSSGRFSSKDGAVAHLARVRNAGHRDAYVREAVPD